MNAVQLDDPGCSSLPLRNYCFYSDEPLEGAPSKPGTQWTRQDYIETYGRSATTPFRIFPLLRISGYREGRVQACLSIPGKSGIQRLRIRRWVQSAHRWWCEHFITRNRKEVGGGLRFWLARRSATVVLRCLPDLPFKQPGQLPRWVPTVGNTFFSESFYSLGQNLGYNFLRNTLMKQSPYA